jgi:hypothetical protein
MPLPHGSRRTGSEYIEFYANSNVTPGEMLDMSPDALGWLSTLMVAVVFVAIVAAVSYWLWR